MSSSLEPNITPSPPCCCGRSPSTPSLSSCSEQSRFCSLCLCCLHPFLSLHHFLSLIEGTRSVSRRVSTAAAPTSSCCPRLQTWTWSVQLHTHSFRRSVLFKLKPRASLGASASSSLKLLQQFLSNQSFLNVCGPRAEAQRRWGLFRTLQRQTRSLTGVFLHTCCRNEIHSAAL